ncbi:hypothetical protein COEREDRAFT_78952 [Coemansia reversa NRRL 1564]|uniref:Uncharacterized protein n=1 Tax=Coemansia reversa (strain ATCC 12441 / NRRL 1564) TaxID=763665 RepID=A0A2G5BKV8_COERN|nr:hypothetical protein COEREDRAFT_78952 [Coemansia reversa NRRL 1564]|eukprot:PIA19638.1 hypothetical protein COEREDRAFT_78952 [Coemansia reversa NRRL 1564]
MEANSKPLLKYAEELYRSYSRLIVYSGDILLALPEPRECLSVANIKTKKDESLMFQREWQHLEAILDEYFIRLNDIRTRAHEELDAARVCCLVGEQIDLTLPEATFKLNTRWTKYKQQYDALQKVIDGCAVKDLPEFVEAPPSELGETQCEQNSAMEVDAVDVASPEKAAKSENQDDSQGTHYSPTDESLLVATSNSPQHPVDKLSTAATTELPAQTASEPELIEVDAVASQSALGTENQPIELDSDSEIDDDAMEDIFE